MDYKEIMELPAETENVVIFSLLKESVTDEDIKTGTDPVGFAYAHLIEWAVRNKKFTEYYSHINMFLNDDNGRLNAQEKLEKEKTVIVRFNVSGTPLFGFYIEQDGDPAISFPEKDGMYFVYL